MVRRVNVGCVSILAPLLLFIEGSHGVLGRGMECIHPEPPLKANKEGIRGMGRSVAPRTSWLTGFYGQLTLAFAEWLPRGPSCQFWMNGHLHVSVSCSEGPTDPRACA